MKTILAGILLLPFGALAHELSWPTCEALVYAEESIEAKLERGEDPEWNRNLLRLIRKTRLEMCGGAP